MRILNQKEYYMSFAFFLRRFQNIPATTPTTPPLTCVILLTLSSLVLANHNSSPKNIRHVRRNVSGIDLPPEYVLHIFKPMSMKRIPEAPITEVFWENMKC